MNKIDTFISTIIFTLIILLIITNPNAKEGAINGIALCENFIIPALLPILILTNALMNTKSCIIFEKIFGWFVTKALRLPICTTTAIIFGLIAGFPAGAILTNDLLKAQLIDNDTAKRVMRFNFCGGLAFIITGIGSIKFNNIYYGILIYGINIIVNLLIGFFSSFFYPKIRANNKQSRKYLSFNSAIIKSVDITTNSIIKMCTYIILFSSIINIVNIPKSIIPLFEITNGLCSSDSIMSLNFVCAYISFGGFCIHLQISEILHNIKMKYYDFLFWRILCATICFIITSIYLKIFPQSTDVFSNITSITPELVQINATLSILMIMSSFVFILDLENKKIPLTH